MVMNIPFDEKKLEKKCSHLKSILEVWKCRKLKCIGTNFWKKPIKVNQNTISN